MNVLRPSGRRARHLLCALAAVAVLGAAQAAPGLPSTNVAWVPAAVDADKIGRASCRERVSTGV